jgi:hypothetical protein
VHSDTSTAMAFFSQVAPRPAAGLPAGCQLQAPPHASQAAPRLVLGPHGDCRTLSRLLEPPQISLCLRPPPRRQEGQPSQAWRLRWAATSQQGSLVSAWEVGSPTPTGLSAMERPLLVFLRSLARTRSSPTPF